MSLLSIGLKAEAEDAKRAAARAKRAAARNRRLTPQECP